MPYRPLYVVEDEPQAANHELRGLAACVVVLGLVRVVPAWIVGEPFAAEAIVAALMVVGGAGALCRHGGLR